MLPSLGMEILWRINENGENQEAVVVLNAFKPKQKWWTKNMFDALGETLHYYFWGKNIKYKMQL